MKSISFLAMTWVVAGLMSSCFGGGGTGGGGSDGTGGGEVANVCSRNCRETARYAKRPQWPKVPLKPGEATGLKQATQAAAASGGHVDVTGSAGNLQFRVDNNAAHLGDHPAEIALGSAASTKVVLDPEAEAIVAKRGGA